jgi:hypothetical protein
MRTSASRCACKKCYRLALVSIAKALKRHTSVFHGHIACYVGPFNGLSISCKHYRAKVVHSINSALLRKFWRIALACDLCAKWGGVDDQPGRRVLSKL